MPAQGGRPGCVEGKHFVQLPELGKAKGGYNYSECRHCRAAYDSETTSTQPVRLVARPRNYRNHLRVCVHYEATKLRQASPLSSQPATPPPPLHPVSSNTRSQSAASATSAATQISVVRRPPTREKRARRSLMLEQRTPGSPKKRRSTKKQASPKKKHKRQLAPSEVKELMCALVEMHADNHLSDRFIEQDSVRRVFEILCPGVSFVIPSRRVLGGRLLKEHAQRCKTKAIEALKKMTVDTDGRVNFASDVWMNISKEHLLGAQLTLFGILLTYALPAAGDRHDGLAIAQELEMLMKQAISEGWNIGAVITDNAGQCGRARRIVALRWPQMVFLFCFAHDVNNLVKSVLHSSFPEVAGQAAAAVKTMNQSSSKWLRRAHKLMAQFYGRPLGLRTLCATRWNSMQGCFASLLRVQSALQMLYRQYQGDADFPAPLQVLGSTEFWSSLKRAEAIIAPLSYASHRLQCDENTVGDVVISYGEIYRGFTQETINRNELVKCVEYRWFQCEQPLFMLGYALHPAHAEDARVLPTTNISGIGVLPKIAVYYYRRLFATEDVGVLRGDMFKWMSGTFTRAKPSEIDGGPWNYWKYLAVEKPSSLLPRLAIVVLSIAVNTATCERLFSELGLIHSPLRNRLKSSKTLDIHTVAQHVRQRALHHTIETAKKKLLISPNEREILRESRNINFTPSPRRVQPVVDEANSDEEDPGDGITDAATVQLWGEYLDEVFRDEELDTGFTAADSLLATCDHGAAEPDEFEAIPDAIINEYPPENDPNFPQEKKLKGFRAQKATLEELFGR